MRGVICYYSGSGNTELACAYLAARLGFPVDLVDVITRRTPDLALYDVVGLAASADFGGPPQRIVTFIEGLRPRERQPAFVFDTYGLRNGRTLADMAELAQARGFWVIAGHALRMPESYPPMMALRLGFPDRPLPDDMRKFDEFADGLREALERAERGEAVVSRPVRLGWLDGMSRTKPRTTARDDMGEKLVDPDRCTECGICARGCPYGAIELRPRPVFDMTRCYGCWRCYNSCPERAIHTKRFRGSPYYAGPSPLTRETLAP